MSIAGPGVLIYLNLIASLPPGAPVPPEYINPCLSAPTTTPTAAPTTTVGLPGAQAPGGGPNVGANAPTNFPAYNGTPIVPVPGAALPGQPNTPTPSGIENPAGVPVPTTTSGPAPTTPQPAGSTAPTAVPDRGPGPVPSGTPNSAPGQSESNPTVTPRGSTKATAVTVTVFDADGNPISVVAAPWAYDANGNPVPTDYEVRDGRLIQTVYADEATAYPILADPPEKKAKAPTSVASKQVQKNTNTAAPKPNSMTSRTSPQKPQNSGNTNSGNTSRSHEQRHHRCPRQQAANQLAEAHGDVPAGFTGNVPIPPDPNAPDDRSFPQKYGTPLPVHDAAVDPFGFNRGQRAQPSPEHSPAEIAAAAANIVSLIPIDSQADGPDVFAFEGGHPFALIADHDYLAYRIPEEHNHILDDSRGVACDRIHALRDTAAGENDLLEFVDPDHRFRPCKKSARDSVACSTLGDERGLRELKSCSAPPQEERSIGPTAEGITSSDTKKNCL
ncbi:unnamed protein product, partial [Mesorhabditis spiculigera]